ncbi:MAG: hypothetical protein CL610_28450 [Anaerolineaceae bacterium]|nr:hypothetical protein [Anaerolineaceae bacterium]
MLSDREKEIVNLVNSGGGSAVRQLAEYFDVTEATIRRDLRKLENLQLLERTHGGAVPAGAGLGLLQQQVEDSTMGATDALILAPVQNNASHTLRERTLRKNIPFLAESCPQDGAIYLGPDNYEAGYLLGQWTGEQFLRARVDGTPAYVLDITQNKFPNTRERSRGFKDGIRAVLDNRLHIESIDGGGLYSNVYQVVADALRLHPEINIMFGINDDSILAGMQAYLDLNRNPDQLIAVNVGVEGDTVIRALTAENPLAACVGLFPDAVARLAIAAIVHLWNGEEIGDAVMTPYALLTADNVNEYYRETRDGWAAIPEAWTRLRTPAWVADVSPLAEAREVSFVILYRTHEWYQNLARAMARYAADLNIRFTVRDLAADLNNEIRELRRLIGKMAASLIQDGDTVLLDTGIPTSNITQFIQDRQNLTVITNSLDVFQRLHRSENLKLILTGGEYDPESGSFTGRGAHLLLNEIRVDKAFLVAGGISTDFGISSVTMAEAELRRTMIRAAREIIVLADHTVLDSESNYHVATLDSADILVTDSGIWASQRLAFSQMGIEVLVAGEVEDHD